MVAGSIWPLIFTLGKAWSRGLLPYNELATFCKFLKNYKTTPMDYKLIYLYKIINVHVLDSVIRDWLEPLPSLKSPQPWVEVCGPTTQSQATHLINNVFANL
jgi:hypothetical protein